MAIKKKVRMTSAEKAKAMISEDYMTQDQIAPVDQYQTPVDVQKAANAAELAGIKFLNDDDRRAFMAMSDEEKTAYIEENKLKNRKRTIRASSLMEPANTLGL